MEREAGREGEGEEFKEMCGGEKNLEKLETVRNGGQ